MYSVSVAAYGARIHYRKLYPGLPHPSKPKPGSPGTPVRTWARIVRALRRVCLQVSLSLGHASWIGDLNPPVLHAAFIGVVVCDGLGPPVAFRGHPRRGNAMLR